MAAIEQGYQQREIRKAAYETQRKIESGELVVVGVNKFRLENEKQPELLRVDPAIAEKQKAKLERLRQKRDNALVAKRLEALRKAARGTENLMPYILDAVRAYCTVGEICGVLREEFGEYQGV